MNKFNAYAPSWGGMFALLGMLLCGALLGNFATLALSLTIGAENAQIYGMLLSYPLMFLPPVLYALAKSKKAMERGEQEIPLNDFVMPRNINIVMLLAICILGTIALAISTEPLIKILPAEPDWFKEAMKMLAGGPVWVALLCTSVFAPVLEEWLCRGMVMRGLLRTQSPAVAIFASAAFFALIHLNPWQAVPAFILGSVFGLVYYKTGALWLTMLMHCANNAFSVILMQSPRFKDAEFLSDVITDPSQYRLILACALCMSVLMVYRLLKLE